MTVDRQYEILTGMGPIKGGDYIKVIQFVSSEMFREIEMQRKDANGKLTTDMGRGRICHEQRH